VAVDGPDHARVYTCEIRIDDEVLGHGRGTSKKTAEQECARAAHETLKSSQP
jgi:ribonuclease-3